VALRVIAVYGGDSGADAPPLARELARLGLSVTTFVTGTGIGSLPALRRALREADVVHAHGLRAAVAVALARTGGTPFVVTITELPPIAGAAALLTRAITRAVIPAAAAIFASTPELVEAATRLGAREVRFAPPPLPDPPRDLRGPELVREELALPLDHPIVLAAAPLHPDTRLDVLVEAAARWRRRAPQPQVVLAGVGPAYRALVGQATVARAPVTFAGDRSDVVADLRVATPDAEPPDGALPDERASLADLLAAATVAVVTDPRARPGFALAAARAGVALVVPADGSVAGLLTEGVVTVPPGDVEALDEAVSGLLAEAPARSELVAAARERVAGWPGAAALALELAAVYERVSRTTATSARDTPG
jgi:glycosyltransferase involved in cell wall biosynthesis